jgi:hypothetical protein
MAAPNHLNGQPRQPFPKKASAKHDRISGDLHVMAGLIGISRAFFRRRK